MIKKFTFGLTLLALASTGYSQNKKTALVEQGITLPAQKNRGGYNGPASILVDSSWDFNANVAFIYWYASQDAMDLAVIKPDLTTGGSGQVVYPNYGYKPGFKVGLGIDTHFDDWTVKAEYTWLYESDTVTTSSAGQLSPSNWYAHPLGISEPIMMPIPLATLYGGPYDAVGSVWGFHLDMLDLVVGRPFYQGTRLTVEPDVGLRGLTLHQGVGIQMVDASSPGDVFAFTGHSHSWGVGPKAGLTTHWFLWKGLRLESIAGASLLYTCYQSITNVASFESATASAEAKNINALRPIFDLGLGAGYGAYVFNNSLYIDLTARYDFTQFWSQNMIRTYASQLAGRADAIGSLRLHGLTLNLRCDF